LDRTKNYQNSEKAKINCFEYERFAYKVRSSGKQQTDKARRADVLKISFTIAEKLAKSGDKHIMFK
jgi:hypothetical protein